MRRGVSRLIGVISKVVREVSRANAVMRVPEERVRRSSPATPEELEERRRREGWQKGRSVDAGGPDANSGRADDSFEDGSGSEAAL